MTPTTSSEHLTTSSPSDDIPAVVLYVVIVYLSVLAAAGSAGNALVLCVFSKKKDKLTSTLFIIALAAVDFITCLVDFITCLVVMPFTVYMEIVNFHVSSDLCCKLYQFFLNLQALSVLHHVQALPVLHQSASQALPVLHQPASSTSSSSICKLYQFFITCKLYQFFITCNIPFSALVMVAIAVDRYLCICHPFARLLTLARAKILIGLLAAIAASLGACVAMFFGVYERPEARNTTSAVTTSFDDVVTTAAADTDNNDGLVNTGVCKENDLILSHDFQWYYQKLYTFMYPTCLLAVVVLYVLIYRSVLRRRCKRQREKRKTLALVRTAQQTEQHQRPVETPPPEARGAMLELAVEIKAPNEGVSAFEDSTLTTDINGCMTLLPVSSLINHHAASQYYT